MTITHAHILSKACSIWVGQITCSSLCKIEHFCTLCLKVITIEHREGNYSNLCNLLEVSWSTWMLHAWQKANKTDIVFEWHCTYTHQPNMLKLHGLLSRSSCSLPASVNIDFAHIGKGMILWFSLLYRHRSYCVNIMIQQNMCITSLIPIYTADTWHSYWIDKLYAY